MKTLISNARIVTDGQIREGDLLIDRERIARVDDHIDAGAANRVVDARGRWLLPGMIDDQVHFRDPGLTHKGNLATESAAAVAGGITSFMEMPNTLPNTVTRERLREKYDLAAGRAHGNYAFYFGAANDNLEEIRALPPGEACGLKIFMGASTGDMLVDDPDTLDAIFDSFEGIIATHCEDTPTILAHEAHFAKRFGEDIPMSAHPLIRSAEACYRSTELAVGLARKHGSRLHVLHMTTARELDFFEPGPVTGKQITAEACVHHLWFSDADYEALGARIKCNPAIKTTEDRAALRAAVADGRLNIIATDHSPHTLDEKNHAYKRAAAGLPLVQHAVLVVLELVRDGVIDLPTAVERMSHAPAERFGVVDRGHIGEGQYADLVLINPEHHTDVTPENLLCKCAWSPFEGTSFRHHIDATYVNGVPVWDGRTVDDRPAGQRLRFARP